MVYFGIDENFVGVCFDKVRFEFVNLVNGIFYCVVFIFIEDFGFVFNFCDSVVDSFC